VNKKPLSQRMGAQIFFVNLRPPQKAMDMRGARYGAEKYLRMPPKKPYAVNAHNVFSTRDLRRTNPHAAANSIYLLGIKEAV
jgi:hypothetical protein